LKHVGLTLAVIGLSFMSVCGATLLLLAIREPSLHSALIGCVCGIFCYNGGRVLMKATTNPKEPEASC